MKNERIRAHIRAHTSMLACANAIGISKQSLYNKVNGKCEWTVTELLELSRLFKWSVAEFLDIIEYKKTEE